MKLHYQIWFWSNGSTTSGTIVSRFKFLAKRELKKILEQGFLTGMTGERFGVGPNAINRVKVRFG